MLLLFATFTTKIVDFLYFFSTLLTKHLRFLNVNEECTFVFSKLYSYVFSSNKFNPSYAYCFTWYFYDVFLSFVSINFSVVKYLLKGVINKSHFSHFMLNPLTCDVSLKVEFTQCNRFLLFLLLSCVINRAQLTLTHLLKVWNMFKVNNKNIKMISLTSFCCFYH